MNKIALWKDVLEKANRILASGGVTITYVTDSVVAGDVVGDHGVYESMIVFDNHDMSISDSTCNCAWGDWQWERDPGPKVINPHGNGGYGGLRGRKCSHLTALYNYFMSISQAGFEKRKVAGKTSNHVERKAVTMAQHNLFSLGFDDEIDVDDFVNYMEANTDGDWDINSDGAITADDIAGEFVYQYGGMPISKLSHTAMCGKIRTASRAFSSDERKSIEEEGEGKLARNHQKLYDDSVEGLFL